MHRKRRLLCNAVATSALLIAVPAFCGSDTEAVDKAARSGMGSQADKPMVDPPTGMPNPDTLPARSGLGSEADRGAGLSTQPVPHMEAQRSGNVTYIVGGVDPDQRRRLEGMRGDYNLQIAMPSPSGAYHGGGMLEIEHADGRPLLQTQVDAPMVLAKVPPGSYTINLTAHGKRSSREIAVPASGNQDVALTWPGSSAAGDAPDR